MKKRIFGVLLSLLILLIAGCTDNSADEREAPYNDNTIFSRFM